MGRVQWVELADLPWWPQVLRQHMTDYLAFILNLTKGLEPVAPLLAQAMRTTGDRTVLDLCAGSGGPWPHLAPLLAQEGVLDAVVQSDLRPRVLPDTRVEGVELTAHPEPIDATQVPPDVPGFRTLINAFHHFPPDVARAILQDAVDKRRGIAVFESVERQAAFIVVSFFLIAPMVLLTTPFIRPFSLSRLALTYLVPILPAAIWFDGIVSSLRIYDPDELRELVAGVDGADTFDWHIERVALSKAQAGVTTLIGVPKPG